MEQMSIQQVKRKYSLVQQALKTLEEALYYYQIAQKSKEQLNLIPRDVLIKTLRDSLIQRFEYCFDSEWKYIKIYLEAEYGIQLKIIAPAPIFRACFKARLMTEEETSQALRMLEDRNLTTHVYLEHIAERVSGVIPAHLAMMKKILKKVAV